MKAIKTIFVLILLFPLLGFGQEVDTVNLMSIQIRDEITYRYGSSSPFSGVGVLYYDNCKTCEKILREVGTYKDGKKEGLWTRWHLNSPQKKSEGKVVNGYPDGVWTFWYRDGKKEQEEIYKDGKKYGIWTIWHRDGRKMYERTFKDGKEISHKQWD